MSKNISRDELLQVAATILSGGIAGISQDVGGVSGGIINLRQVSTERIHEVVDIAEKLIEEVDNRYDNTAELKFEPPFNRDTLLKDDEFIDETLNDN